MSTDSSDLTIEQMQDAIMARGWQWLEHVFNDGKPGNCFVTFTQDKGVKALTDTPKPADRVGWGRYPRRMAWSYAYDLLVLGIEEA